MNNTLKTCYLFIFEVDWDSGSELSDEEAEDIEQKELYGLVDPLSKVSIQAETCSVENSTCKASDGKLKGENVDNATISLGHFLEAAVKEFGKKEKETSSSFLSALRVSFLFNLCMINSAVT